MGQIVRPLTAPAFNAQFAFRCTTAGTASTEPSWPGGNNQTVTTGGATFTNVSGQGAYGWSAAVGNLYCVSNSGGNRPVVAGDRIFLSSDHSETNAVGNPIYAFGPSGGYGLIQLISVNRAGSVPPAQADALSGATITVTSGGFYIDAWTDCYWQGINFVYATTGTGFLFNSGGLKRGYFRNCSFYLNSTNGGSRITINNTADVTWDNTTVQFANVAHAIQGGSFGYDFTWINTPSAIQGSTIPTFLFNPSTSGMLATLRGVDLSALNTTLWVANSSIANKLLLDSCRIAGGVTRYGVNTLNTTADVVELVNCFDGSNILSERRTPSGALTTNRTTTLVGGAQDDVGLFSHQMVSNANSDFLTLCLDSFWMDVEQSAVGASHTATVELISSGSLNNTDIALVVEYQGTAGSSLATLISTLPSALTAAAALPTSTATWNSPPATPVAQHLQATFTPQTAGRVRGLVRLGKPSTTVFVNPQITIT